MVLSLPNTRSASRASLFLLASSQSPEASTHFLGRWRSSIASARRAGWEGKTNGGSLVVMVDPWLWGRLKGMAASEEKTWGGTGGCDWLPTSYYYLLIWWCDVMWYYVIGICMDLSQRVRRCLRTSPKGTKAPLRSLCGGHVIFLQKIPRFPAPPMWYRTHAYSTRMLVFHSRFLCFAKALVLWFTWNIPLQWTFAGTWGDLRL